MTTFTVRGRDGAARTGVLHTPHGDVRTPAFMPVGTHAAVRTLHPDEVRATGADILLCNAYHLALRPGVEAVARCGGMHEFMGWDGAILTDSGGYQLVSLKEVAKVDDAGAEFISPYDGSRLRVTPEAVVELQARLGADIMMCLDHPVAWGAAEREVVAATHRTHAWAARSRTAHPGDGRLLFGIVQGGFDAALRRESAAQIASLGFDGNALGGLSVGEPLSVMEEMTAVSVAALPESAPRYFMGLGTDRELLSMVALGIDMFDCVLPTRLARNGTALTPHGRLALGNAAFASDARPLDETCPCPACARFSRAYLRHLFKCGEILAHRMVTQHNLTHLGRLMARACRAIDAGSLAALRAEVEASLRDGGEPEPG